MKTHRYSATAERRPYSEAVYTCFGREMPVSQSFGRMLSVRCLTASKRPHFRGFVFCDDPKFKNQEGGNDDEKTSIHIN